MQNMEKNNYSTHQKTPNNRLMLGYKSFSGDALLKDAIAGVPEPGQRGRA